MGYDSTITFTLDTICPWTYLAKKRLDKALAIVRAENPPVTFTVHYAPFQLFEDAPETGEDKYTWYLTHKYNNSTAQMQKYTMLMSAYGVAEGIDFKFGGTIARTLHAHRIIQHFQGARGADTAEKLVTSLYRQYFEEERHPSSHGTLLQAAGEAGVAEAEARRVVVEEEGEGLSDVRALVREQKANGVDAVPFVVVEGKRRDVALEGAKSVEEYVKALRTVVKEAA